VEGEQQETNMTKKHPDVTGKKAWICRNCGNDPIFERDPEFEKPECPRCGETILIKRRPPTPL